MTTTTDTPKTDELAGLAAMAQQIPSSAPQGMEPAGAAPGAEQSEAGAELVTESNSEMITGVLILARDTAQEILDLRTPGLVLTDERAEKLGTVWGRVADKRGWKLAGVMGDYKEEIFAFMMTFTLAREMNHAVGLELAAKKHAKQQQATAQAATVEPASDDQAAG